MQTSDEINEIASALAKAQGAIQNPSKTAENPHFRSKYADLAAGLNAVRQALSSNGIAVLQATRVAGDLLMLDTRLLHASGQWIQSEFLACRAGIPPQQVGSALSYARRYSLFALIGIAGDDDDDGNTATAGHGTGNGKDEAFISDIQVAELRAKIDAVGADEQRFLRFLKVGALATLPIREFSHAMAELDRKAQK